MPLTVKLTPGKVVTEADIWTVALLNAIANPTVELEGAIGTLTIGAGAISNLSQMVDGFFTADAAGRAKFAPGFVNTALLEDASVTYAKLATDARVIGAPSRGVYTNLTAQTNVATPLSKVDVVATDLIVKGVSNVPVCLPAVAVTVDMGLTPGNPNALDTGAEAPSTWYYIWIVYDGTNTAGLFSLSNTAPTLAGALAGYTYKALVGAVRNGATSNFVQFYQAGRVVSMPESAVFNNRTGIAALAMLDNVGGTADALTNFQAAVPAIAKVAFGNMGISSAAPANGGMTVAGNVPATGPPVVVALGSVGFTGLTSAVVRNLFYVSSSWRLGLQQNNMAWTTFDTTANAYRLTVTGFEL